MYLNEFTGVERPVIGQ